MTLKSSDTATLTLLDCLPIYKLYPLVTLSAFHWIHCKKINPVATAT